MNICAPSLPLAEVAGRLLQVAHPAGVSIKSVSVKPESVESLSIERAS